MKYALIASLLTLIAQPALAAITTNFDCKSSDGARVYWEAQDGIFDEEGNQTGTYLYRNKIAVTLNDVSVDIEPYKVLTDSNNALLAAWTKDGQYVIVNAAYKAETSEFAEATYKGTLEFKVKSKNGTIRRKEGTKVVCDVTGEA